MHGPRFSRKSNGVGYPCRREVEGIVAARSSREVEGIFASCFSQSEQLEEMFACAVTGHDKV